MGAQRTFAAMAHLDRAVTEVGGIALRYGGFYGNADNPQLKAVRRRLLPMIGSGDGVTSWIHLDDAAAATVLALEHDGPRIYNIVDDDPAPLREWLPELARVLGAKPPRHVPDLGGPDPRRRGRRQHGATQSRGASNARAQTELGWTLRYPRWRQGFAAAYGSTATVGTAPNPRPSTAAR